MGIKWYAESFDIIHSTKQQYKNLRRLMGSLAPEQVHFNKEIKTVQVVQMQQVQSKKAVLKPRLNVRYFMMDLNPC